MSSTQTPPTSAGAGVAGLCDELQDLVVRFRAEAGAGTVRAAVGPGLVEVTKQLWEAIDRLTAVAVEATATLHGSSELLEPSRDVPRRGCDDDA